MGQTYEHLNDKQIAFIGVQKVFFVATAPLSEDGHVNLSPKGYDTFRVLGAREVAYCDLGGSGIETVAHIRENGRLTIMFCAFEGPAMILRLYGKGRVTQFDDPAFARELERFGDQGRVRNIVHLDIERVSDSCGWGVPFFDYREPREQLKRAIAHPSDADLQSGWRTSNAQSIDGLPGIKPSGGD